MQTMEPPNRQDNLHTAVRPFPNVDRFEVGDNHPPPRHPIRTVCPHFAEHTPRRKYDLLMLGIAGDSAVADLSVKQGIPGTVQSTEPLEEAS